MKTIRSAAGLMHTILKQSMVAPKIDPPRSQLVRIFIVLTLILTVWLPTTEGQDNGANSLVSVRTIQPEKITLQFTTTQPATVHPYFEAELYAKVAGYLKELYVDIGDEVEEGQKLAEIDVPEMLKAFQRQEAEVTQRQIEKARCEAGIEVAQAKIAQVQAAVQAAEALVEADESEYKRIEQLIESKAVTQSLHDETFNRLQASKAALASQKANHNVAQAEFKVAQAIAETAGAAIIVAQKQTEELNVLMGYATIRAPFKGVVTSRNVDPGDLVQNAQTSAQAGNNPLFTIAQLDQVRVRVLIPQRDVALADVGDKAQFKHDVQSEVILEGAISRVSKWLEPKTRTMMVEIDLPNPDHQLLPGIFGQVTIMLEERQDQLVLPAACIRQSEDGAASFVYVVDAGNKVHHAPVKTGKDDGQQIEIVSGLSGKEQVVTGMLGRLATNQTVKVIN